MLFTNMLRSGYLSAATIVPTSDSVWSNTINTNSTKDDIKPGFPKFVSRVFIGVGILAMLSLGIYVVGKIYGKQLVSAGNTTDTTKVEVVISNDVFLVPKNMIRHEDERVDGITNRLGVYVFWPTFSGYSDDLVEEFAANDADTIKLVLLTFAPRRSLLDMSDRYEPVYLSALVPNSKKQLSNGLWIADLSPEYGYINERLIYAEPDETGRPRFIARCQASDIDQSRLLLPCETDLFVGTSTEMKARFGLTQLSRWEDFARELKAFPSKLLVGE